MMGWASILNCSNLLPATASLICEPVCGRLAEIVSFSPIHQEPGWFLPFYSGKIKSFSPRMGEAYPPFGGEACIFPSFSPTIEWLFSLVYRPIFVPTNILIKQLIFLTKKTIYNLLKEPSPNESPHRTFWKLRKTKIKTVVSVICVFSTLENRP